jgi:GT2 family glycosyltransferase
LAPHPVLTVVVPTYQRPELLRRCLRSLRGQDLPEDLFQVVVIDDGSGDATTQVLEDQALEWPQLEWRSQPTNKGPAAARNLGLASAAGDLILFVDDDIVAPPDLLSKHLHLHQPPDPRRGVVGRVEWHPELEVTPFMRWLDTTDLQFKFATMEEGQLERPWEAFYTCNLSLPAPILEEVGGFDERFPYPAFEDTDLGLRLSRRGFRLEYRSSVLAWHARAVSLDEFSRRMRKVGESATLLRSAQPDLPFDLPVRTEGPRGARKVAVSALPLVAKVLPSRGVRGLAYRAAVNRAYREGVLAGMARAGSVL